MSDRRKFHLCMWMKMGMKFCLDFNVQEKAVTIAKDLHLAMKTEPPEKTGCFTDDEDLFFVDDEEIGFGKVQYPSFCFRIGDISCFTMKKLEGDDDEG